MEEKCVFVFNNGNGAILCSGCRRILKRGFEYTTDELRASMGEIDLEPQYCEICASGNKGLEVCLDSNE